MVNSEKTKLRNILMEYLAKNKVSQLCLVTSKLNFRTFAYIIRALQHAYLCTHLTFNRALALTKRMYDMIVQYEA